MFSGKLKWWLLLGIFLIGLSLNLLPQSQFSQSQAQSSSRSQPQILPVTARAIIRDQIIELEVARTIPEQSKGLMFRTELPPNRGMLFPYDPPQFVSFWMKNCLISLDLIFIRDQTVIGIQAEAPPCETTPCPVYPSPGPVDNVLELAGGQAAALGLNVGDPLEIKPLN